MTSIEEFIAARISIETLAGKIAESVENNALQDSKRHLNEANRQLEILKTMVANDVQEIVAGRLSRQLTELGSKVETKTAKASVKKTTEKKTKQKTVRAPSKPSNRETE